MRLAFGAVLAVKSGKKQFAVSRIQIAVAGLLLSWCVLANCCGQGGPPPKITVQPQNQTVPSGGTAAFTVVVSGLPPLTYQWRFNGASIAGATNIAYTLSNAQYTNAGFYSVAVANLGGSDVSSNATLTVINTPLRFVAVGWDSTGFTGRLEGPIAANYVLSVSTDFRDWIPIATNLATTGSWNFSDPRSLGRPLGYYRAAVQ